jgi:hypothetical protein
MYFSHFLRFKATWGKNTFNLLSNYSVMSNYEESGPVHSFLYLKKINGKKIKALKSPGRCDQSQI